MRAELTNKVTVNYELLGSGDSIVLIAGYRGDNTMWKTVKAQLTPRFQVLTFDNLGIGQTLDDNSPLSIEKMADMTMELVDHLQLKKPHIVGQSMGGTVAQVIAKKYSEKISKLILLNTVITFNKATLLNLETMLQLRKENVSPDILLNAGLPWQFSSSFLETEANIQPYKKLLMSNPNPQSIENQMRQLAALNEFDSTEWINTINKPTLVVASKNDILALPNESQSLANNIKGATFKLISGGHSSLFEAPNEVSELIKDFL